MSDIGVAIICGCLSGMFVFMGAAVGYLNRIARALERIAAPADPSTPPVQDGPNKKERKEA